MHMSPRKPDAAESPAAAPVPLAAGPQLGSLRDYWALLMRRKLTVGVVFVIVSAAAVLGALIIPPVYTAQTAVMIKHGREFYYRAAAGSPDDRSLFSLQEMVNSEVEVLRGRDLAEQVIRELGAQRVYPEMFEDPEADPARVQAAAVARFQDNVVVMDVLESGIIRITFDHGDPDLAAEALNLLVERFKDKHVEIFGEPATDFISDQLADYEARLAASEDEFGAFRQTHGVYSLAEQKSLLLKQQMELETELNAAEFRISELEQQLVLLNGARSSDETPPPPPYPTQDRESLIARRAALSTVLQEAEMRLAELQQQLLVFRDRTRTADEGVAPMPGVENYRSVDEAFLRLLDLQLQEKELLRTFNESNRQVVAVRSQMETVHQFLRERGAYVKGVIEVTLRDELEGLAARRAAALDQIESVDALIRAFDVRQTLDELAPLQVRRDRIRQELDEREAEILALDQNEKDYRQLERRVVLDERNYQAFVDVSEEARIMEELDRQKMVNIAVIERAHPPIEPSSLSRKWRVVLGAFVGLFAGAAAALFLELAGS